MKRLIAIYVLTIALAAVLSAADVTGTWKGDFDFQGTAIPLQFNLKSSGTSLTGTVEGLPTSPAAIKEGKVDGNNVSFSLETDYQGTTYKLLYKGQVVGNEIRFKFNTEDNSFASEVVAKKAT